MCLSVYAAGSLCILAAFWCLQDFQEQPDGTAQDVERRRVLCDKLEKLIAHEDPYNGESVVRIISKGFDSPSVESPSDDWKI